MTGFKAFRSWEVIALSPFRADNWKIKRYSIVADGRKFDEDVVNAASQAVIERLPDAGNLENKDGNHGIGFQIIHFAETAVVSPYFYWIWESVLVSPTQLRASLDAPNEFSNGIADIVGCVWEMQICSYEVDQWTQIMLNGSTTSLDASQKYVNQTYSEPSAVGDKRYG